MLLVSGIFISSCSGNNTLTTLVPPSPQTTTTTSTPTTTVEPTTITTSGSTSTTTSTSSSEKYLMYSLKDGADKTKLFGTPWLDLSRNGIVKMIEKPNLKEDFYGNINYDILNNLEVGENTAMVGDMAVMLRLTEKDTNFNYKKFFESYANVYVCTLNDQMYIGGMIYNDSHPLAMLRVNNDLNQFQKFLDTYVITKGNAMYVAPSDRLIIW